MISSLIAHAADEHLTAEQETIQDAAAYIERRAQAALSRAERWHEPDLRLLVAHLVDALINIKTAAREQSECLAALGWLHPVPRDYDPSQPQPPSWEIEWQDQEQLERWERYRERMRGPKSRRGRLSLEKDKSAFQTYQRVLEWRHKVPGLSWKDCAKRAGIHERTFRKYRRRFGAVDGKPT